MNCKTCRIPLENQIYKNCQSCRNKKNEYKQRYFEKHPEQLDKKNEWSKLRMRQRRETPEFRLREAEYLADYCNRKGTTYKELWEEISEKRVRDFTEFIKTATLDDAVKSKFFIRDT